MDGDFTLGRTGRPDRAAVDPAGPVGPVGPPEPSLYTGAVVHKRLQPFVHTLDYSVFSLLLDIDCLAQTSRQSGILKYNKPGVVSFYDKDHGPRDGTPIRPWLDRTLTAQGVDGPIGPVRLLCFPRLWGYVFNPLSIYYCYRPGGQLAAVLYEVCNTFGEWHGYLLKADTPDGGDPIRQTTEKVFHVSPFMPVDGRYAFTLKPPSERLSLTIRYQDADGVDRMIARHMGKRADLSRATVLRALLRHPLMTWKVTAGIHWEALKLWLKGAVYHPKPAPPEHEITR